MSHLSQQPMILVPAVDAGDSVAKGAEVEGAAMLQAERIFDHPLWQHICPCGNNALQLWIGHYLRITAANARTASKVAGGEEEPTLL